MVVTPGKSGECLLIDAVLAKDRPRMPPKEEGEPKKKVYTFSAIVIGSRVAEIWAISDKIPSGSLQLGGRNEAESQLLINDLKQAKRATP